MSSILAQSARAPPPHASVLGMMFPTQMPSRPAFKACPPHSKATKIRFNIAKIPQKGHSLALQKTSLKIRRLSLNPPVERRSSPVRLRDWKSLPNPYGCFQKLGSTPKSSILRGCSIIFTIHFGVSYFWKPPYDQSSKSKTWRQNQHT